MPNDDFPIPQPPTNPPIMIFYTEPGADHAENLRYYGQEHDLGRAHMAARRLLNQDAFQVLLINGLQVITKPDDPNEKK